MGRIISYTEAETLNSDDYLLIDGNTDGSRKISITKAIKNDLGEVTKYNSRNLLAYTNRVDTTFRGVTYSWTGFSCTVSGTADSGNASFIKLAGGTSILPEGMYPGEKYHIKYAGENVSLFFSTTVNGTSKNTAFYNDGNFTVPSDATGLEIRLRVGAGVTANETVMPVILDAYTNKELETAVFEIKQETANLLDDTVITRTNSTSNNVSFTWESDGGCNISTNGGVASATTIKNFVGGTSTIPDAFTAGKTYLIEYSGTDVALGINIYKNGTTIAVKYYFSDFMLTVPSDATGLELRFRVNNGDSVNETVYPPRVRSAYTNKELTQKIDPVENIAEDLSKNNASDIMLYQEKHNENVNSVWFKWTGNICSVSGTATANTIHKIAGSSDAFPDGTEIGGLYHIKHHSENVSLSILQHKEGGTTKTTNFFDDAEFKFDYDAVGAEIRLRVTSGTTVNETVSPAILNAYGNKELTEAVVSLKTDATSNILTDINRTNGTSAGVNWHWNSDGTCTVTGTATETSVRTLVGGADTMPDVFEAGKTYYIQYENENVAMHIVVWEGATQISSQFFFTSGSFTIPPEATAVMVRLRVGTGRTANDTVYPKITRAYTNEELTDKVEDSLYLNNAILNVANSYYVMCKAGYIDTYGSESATNYTIENPRQIHCGCYTEMVIGGCPFYQSRYVGNQENGLYAGGYGFDYYAYGLALALTPTEGLDPVADAELIARIEAERTFIGTENLDKTVNELKRLRLYAVAKAQAKALDRWGMTFEILTDGRVDESLLQIGDIIFYGKTITNPDSDGNLHGYTIAHVDVIVGKKNGKFYVADGGAVPITIHPLRVVVSPSNVYQYMLAGRVPLKYSI